MGAPAAAARDRSPHHQSVFVVAPVGEQLRARRRRLRQLDDRLDPGLVASGADQIGARAAAAQQAERLDEDALAGAGLTGHRGQAGPERDLRLVDQSEPGNLEQRQHGDPSSTGDRFSRKIPKKPRGDR